MREFCMYIQVYIFLYQNYNLALEILESSVDNFSKSGRLKKVVYKCSQYVKLLSNFKQVL